MRGPAILARTMSVASARGQGASWQYHSRSDNHSKVACWTLLFDLLIECDALRHAAERGRIGFGINHVMVGQINKTLDLVVSIVPPERSVARRRTFRDIAGELRVVLDNDDVQRLDDLPVIVEDHRTDVSEVAIALEAKACMTEHVKSLPRLHAEILATGYLARKASPRSITVSYSLVNAAREFVTPSASASRINRHRQPDDTRRVIDMIRNAVPTFSDARDYGYDVVGITVVECRNDGSPVRVIDDPTTAPARTDRTHYERMVRSICSEFRGRFPR
ncbi:hypothetical protein [Azohydromonas sp.]|uniref:hypothetical protein n=1 Tax=Azohydromonas sp. TaxID=1872666 RepID=UPI002D1FA61E|nr:hypothetical protein [Azohydromonas sp.]